MRSSRIEVEGACYKSESTEPAYSEEDEGLYAWQDQYEAWQASRTIVQSESQDFKIPEQRMDDQYASHGSCYTNRKKSLDLRKEYGKLQIIVKLANIHLTPEQPRYEGGSWHVEGQLNENMYLPPDYG